MCIVWVMWGCNKKKRGSHSIDVEKVVVYILRCHNCIRKPVFHFYWEREINSGRKKKQQQKQQQQTIKTSATQNQMINKKRTVEQSIL